MPILNIYLTLRAHCRPKWKMHWIFGIVDIDNETLAGFFTITNKSENELLPIIQIYMGTFRRRKKHELGSLSMLHPYSRLHNRDL